MKVSKIEHLVELLNQAFTGLRVVIAPREIETMAVMIHKTMTAQARSYHTVEHVFRLADGASPIRSLAALFHDLVYYQADKGIPPEIRRAISPPIEEQGGEVLISEQTDLDDRRCLLPLLIFGLQPGQTLSPVAGLNEFLSALYLNMLLGGLLWERDLVKVTVCIEATIPFRGPDESGTSCFDRLEGRLRAVNKTLHLAMSEAEMVDLIREAVVFANGDVDSFAETDPGRFLDDTWLLLPETNAALRSGEVYSIREYRQALQKMGGFVNFLNPDHVFHCYRGVPAEEEYRDLADLARRNISTARDYLGVKLLAIAVLEALAEISGGDAPLSLFMGDSRRKVQHARSLESYLPVLEAPAGDRSLVSRLLAYGRASESIFDIKNSPTSLYLLSVLGADEVQRLLPHAEAMFAGQLDVRGFLNQVDGAVVAAVAKAAGQMVSTRRALLLQYARSRE